MTPLSKPRPAAQARGFFHADYFMLLMVWKMVVIIM